ncbi:protein of unknown function, hydrolase-like type [Roseibacterium elongatum DSM 19469]|uniref:Uncharacterized protein n=2 Tax=Roseicyclus elongatus TaxID=159346 RepID=W8S4F5_9RHOB|nr:protein of unknown function, hydrolase-like type [Roseibacterium elongatum DSM 19469]
MAMAQPSSAQSDVTFGEVPFLTLRNQTGGDHPGDLFGEERSGLSAGRCQVRELDFQGLAPLAEAAPTFLREEFLTVEDVTLSDPADVIASLQSGEGPGRPRALCPWLLYRFRKRMSPRLPADGERAP